MRTKRIPRNAVVRFGAVTVEFDDDGGFVNHCWKDTGLTAEVRDEKEDVARARSLGYEGTDPEVAREMHREHDVAHHLVAQALGWDASLVLRLAAEGREAPFPVGIVQLEERLAFLVQRVGNLGLAGLLEADGRVSSPEAT